jgi:excisionase family DNA binding protein
VSAVARALIEEFTPEQLAELAERLRPYLRDGEALLTPQEAAQRLGVHPKTITRAAAAGRVPGAVRVGRTWRFRADELALESPENVTPAPAPLRPKRVRGAAVDAIRGAN